MPDLVIRGGDVVTPEGVIRADIAIDGERFSSIGTDLPGGMKEFDARGLTILPGLIDVHVHFNEPGRTDWEGGSTGSRALAAGGGTMFIDMPLNSTPCTVTARAFDAKRKALEEASITDFGLWGGIVPGNLPSLPELAERGVIGFKAFLCDSGLPEFPRADDETLYAAMSEAACLGLPVAVHAENEETTKTLAQRLIQANQNDVRAFLASRPVAAEVEAIRRAGRMARETGCRLHVVHISSGSGVAAALEARAAGADISLETCPHYLFFTGDDMLRLGAVAKCAPPLRSSHEREALWRALLRGDIDIVGSDHSPCAPELKQRSSFFEVWGGIAGVQSTLPVMLDRGVQARGLALEHLAAITASNGARRFRIAGKGKIEPGFHADLALVDLRAIEDIRPEALLNRHPVSPYIGQTLRGCVRATFRRGERIWSDGEITAQTPGKHVRPELNAHAESTKASITKSR
jgi:allantoinase